MEQSIAMSLFTYLFLATLILGLTIEQWLLWRHRHHIAAYRSAVPEAFRDQVSLEQHQKAADYTLARTALTRWEQPFGALILMGWLFRNNFV